MAKARRDAVCVIRSCPQSCERLLEASFTEVHHAVLIAAPPAAWRSILEALAVAAGDSSPQVVSGAMQALQQVIELLFQVLGIHQLSVL
jgi:hypothetical protein